MSFTHHHTPEQDGPGSVGHAHDPPEVLVWEDFRQIGHPYTRAGRGLTDV